MLDPSYEALLLGFNRTLSLWQSLKAIWEFFWPSCQNWTHSKLPVRNQSKLQISAAAFLPSSWPLPCRERGCVGLRDVVRQSCWENTRVGTVPNVVDGRKLSRMLPNALRRLLCRVIYTFTIHFFCFSKLASPLAPLLQKHWKNKCNSFKVFEKLYQVGSGISVSLPGWTGLGRAGPGLVHSQPPHSFPGFLCINSPTVLHPDEGGLVNLCGPLKKKMANHEARRPPEVRKPLSFKILGAAQKCVARNVFVRAELYFLFLFFYLHFETCPWNQGCCFLLVAWHFCNILENCSLLHTLCNYLIAFWAQLTAEATVTAFYCTTLRSTWHLFTFPLSARLSDTNKRRQWKKERLLKPPWG